MTGRQVGLVVIGGLALLALAVMAIGTVARRDRTEDTARSFFLAATFRSHLPDDDGEIADEVHTLRWWYSPTGSRWRHETGESESEPAKVSVSDGEQLWQYYPREALYCVLGMQNRGSVLTIPDAMTPAFVGPSSAKTFDQLVGELGPPGSGIEVTVLRTEEYLQRTVTVVEYSPASPPGGGWRDSIGTIWIDVEDMFVVMHTIVERSGSGRSLASSVTSLEFGPIDSDLFRFEPPHAASRFEPVEHNCDQGLPREP